MKTKAIIFQIILVLFFFGNLPAKNTNNTFQQQSKSQFNNPIATNDEMDQGNSVPINISQFIIKDMTDPFDLIQIDLQVTDAIRLNQNGNPNEISINLSSKKEDHYFLELFDNNGTLLYSLETRTNKIDKLLDFSKFDIGNYKLLISNINDEISIKYNIEKLK
jgi:hypothetical protein